MFNSYEALPILEKLPLHIESINAYDGNLVVGTKQGHLLMYQISLPSGGRIKVSLLRSNKKFSHKPINQIAVVPEHQILVSLSDQLINIHDLSIFNLPLLISLTKTKGATSFDIDVKHHTSLTGETVTTVRLVVAVRRRIQFYYWKARQFHELREDFTLTDYAKSVKWINESIVISYKHDYWILALDGKQKELFPTGRSQEPLITCMFDGCLALERDEKTIFIDDQGKSTYPSLEWPEQPIDILYDAPYMIAILSKEICIQSHEPNLLIQKLELEKVRFLTSTQVDKKWQVFAASPTHIWCLNPLPISQQIPHVLRDNHFELAQKLAGLWHETDHSKVQMKKHIEKLHAFHLFTIDKFSGAMSKFLSLNTDLLFVIGLFPGLVPEEYRSRLEYPKPVPEIGGAVLIGALQELVHFLLQVRHNLVGSGEKIIRDSDTDSPTVKSKSQLLQIIETTLLKCYLKTNPSLVVPLLRMPDSRVSVEEGERVLRQAKKYEEVVVLLKARGLHHRALQLLLRHSKREGSPLEGHKHTVNYLKEMGASNLDLIFEYSGWVMKVDLNEGLKIFTGDEDSLGDVESLPRPRILSFLKKSEKELVIPYIEHCIWEWGDENPFLHNELIHQYRDLALHSLPQNHEEDYLQAKTRREDMYSKLLLFLTSSKSYNAATILVHFPNDALHEARAILLGRLGQHSRALQLYVEVLENTDQALEYCHAQYTPDGHGKEVYLHLLKLLLTSPNSDEKSEKERHKLVLYMLDSYAHFIDIGQALRLLPPSMPLSLLRTFLMRSLSKLSSKRRETHIQKGLAQALGEQCRIELSLQQNAKVILSDKVFCSVCCKRFTSSSAFAWLPNGDILHFSCQAQRKR